MPSTGFYLFLLLHKKPLRHFIESVNALNGLLLISSQNICNLNRILCVSMPSTGFYLFLLLINQIPFWLSCVNALNGLLLISSDELTIGIFSDLIVSMPSTGFYLFLPQIMDRFGIRFVLCQCPQRASTYFFVRNRRRLSESILYVSMPSTGFYLFLQYVLLSAANVICCVSMPSTGFYLFLQYPPRTLDFTEFWRGFLQVIN